MMMYLISILWFGIDYNNILSHCLHNKILSPQLILGKSKHEIYIPNPGKKIQLKKKKILSDSEIFGHLKYI